LFLVTKMAEKQTKSAALTIVSDIFVQIFLLWLPRYIEVVRKFTFVSLCTLALLKECTHYRLRVNTCWKIKTKLMYEKSKCRVQMGWLINICVFYNSFSTFRNVNVSLMSLIITDNNTVCTAVNWKGMWENIVNLAWIWSLK
jgi:hypothetical protein